MAIKQRPTKNATTQGLDAFDNFVDNHMPKWFSNTWLMKDGGLLTPKPGQDSRWLGIPLAIVSGLAVIVLLILRFQ